jgi:hypothetical protein
MADTSLGGLINMGMTCYANSVLQALRHCKKIPWIFEEGRYNTLFQKEPSANLIKQQGFASSFATIAEGFGEIIANFSTGGSALVSIGGLIFSTLGNLAIQVGKIAVSTGIAILGIKKSLASLQPGVAIAAGVALIALGTIVKSQLASAGAFANGGIVGGSSFYGDKILARVNSGELILNNKQQKSLYGMMNTSSDSSTIIPDVKISGQDLLIVFGRAEKNKNRLG